MIPRIFLLMVPVLLAACGGGEHEDIKQWMEAATKDMKGHVTPLPEIKPFPIVAYEVADLVDPFQASKLEPSRKAMAKLLPDLERRKEPLEAYPLESLKMVGTLEQGSKTIALIQADEGIHRVSVGNYLGQDFGKIIQITEYEVVLTELVPGVSGEFEERTSTLQLQAPE